MELLLAALWMGVAGSLHCVGMCGGFAVAAGARGPLHGLAWHAGRWTTYAVAGAALGWLGGGLPGPTWLPQALAAVGLLAFATTLGGWFHVPLRAAPGVTSVAVRLARSPGLLARYGFGLVTGLLPCGMTLAALSLALGAERPALGGAAMVVFGLGTSPALSVAADLLGRVASAGRGTRRMVSLAVLALGLVALAWRGAPADTGGEPCHTHSVSDPTQPLGQKAHLRLDAARNPHGSLARNLRRTT